MTVWIWPLNISNDGRRITKDLITSQEIIKVIKVTFNHKTYVPGGWAGRGPSDLGEQRTASNGKREKLLVCNAPVIMQEGEFIDAIIMQRQLVYLVKRND